MLYMRIFETLTMTEDKKSFCWGVETFEKTTTLGHLVHVRKTFQTHNDAEAFIETHLGEGISRAKSANVSLLTMMNRHSEG